MGLTLKRGAVEERQRFVARPYRFLTEPVKTKKGKAQIILALHREGMDPRAIAKAVGSTAAAVEKAIFAYEAGKQRKPEELRGDLSPNDLCELLGACHAYW